MSLTAAVSGFIVLLLSVSVVQGLDSWDVTYTSPVQMCASKGSAVEMSCTYTYPTSIKGEVNTLQSRFWFREDGDEYKYVETVSEYRGRVKNTCDGNKCTLRITNLMETDAAVYRFRIITDKDKYYGRPGVTLSVTDLQVKVSRPGEALLFECLSRCLADTSYVWFRNGRKLQHRTSSYNPPEQLLHTDSYSCAVRGHEKFPSPPVYAPKLPSVSLSSHGEIDEGSSVNLTCSSDANPAAKYTWYKVDGPLNRHPSKAQLVFSSVKSSEFGEYYCVAENMLGKMTSKHISMNVKWGGELAAIVAGSITVVLLVIMFLSVLLLIRQKRASNDPPEAKERQEHTEQRQPEEQEDIQYASIHFYKTQEHLYSNTRPARPPRRTKPQEVTEYAVVKFTSNSNATRTRRKEPEDDPAALYSTINRS